jgi:hypothetical protein
MLKAGTGSARYHREKLEAMRATTNRTCELLEDIRNMTQDALDFMPGHTMSPEFQKACELQLAIIQNTLAIIQNTLRELNLTGGELCSSK